jgi:hypothetical protein
MNENVIENQIVEGVEVSVENTAEVAKPKKARTPSINAAEFVKVWQQSGGNVETIVAKYGGNPAHLRHRANTLRKQGVPLVETVVKSGGKALDLDELTRLAKSFSNDE